MRNIIYALLGIFILSACQKYTSTSLPDSLVVNGVPWFDQQGNIINSHGSCIVEDHNRYWLFGEYKSDTTNAFPGFGCYSSEDLVNWKFERVVLPQQEDGLMGPNRVGERVKVMRCPSTDKYVMFMHSDDMYYKDPHTVVAISDSINGDYQVVGPLTYKGEPIHRWDIGTFQDFDGTGYLLAHHGPIYRLADDYLTADTLFLDPELRHSGESPALFRKGDIYYLLYSNLTSWERNDNFYFTSHNMAGPWTRQGLFCPENSLTYNSQCTFVLPIIHGSDTTYMYMGDRWSFPHQASCATQVWLPLTIKDEKLSIPTYWSVWNPKNIAPVDIEEDCEVTTMNWRSNRTGDSCHNTFCGTQAIIKGKTDSHGGYARLLLSDQTGKEVLNTLIDCYSLVPDKGIRFVTPQLPLGEYTLTISVEGEQPVCYNKAGHRYGSDDFYVDIESILVKKN